MTGEIDPRVNLLQPDEADDDVRAVYDDIIETRSGEMEDGMSLNGMWLAYGNTPELLEIVWNHMRESYRGGELPFELKSKVSLVAATVLECDACRIFHTERLASEGVDPGEIDRLGQAEIEESVFSEREYEILRFTEKVAGDFADVTDADVDRLREAGVTDAEIVELVDCIALHVHTAVFQDALGLVHDGMTPEDYAAAMNADPP